MGKCGKRPTNAQHCLFSFASEQDFTHGTASGKRVISIDGQEILRKVQRLFYFFISSHTDKKKKREAIRHNHTGAFTRTLSRTRTHTLTHSYTHSLTHSLTHIDAYTLALPSVYVGLDSWMTVRIGCSSLWARRSFNLALQVTNTAARLPSLLQVFGTGETYSVPPPNMTDTRVHVCACVCMCVYTAAKCSRCFHDCAPSPRVGNQVLPVCG